MQRNSTIKFFSSAFAIGILMSAKAALASVCPDLTGGIDYCPLNDTDTSRCSIASTPNSCGASDFVVPGANEYIDCNTCELKQKDVQLGSDSIQTDSTIIQSASPTFFIKSDGLVGIGTTTPAVSLDVYSTDAIRMPVGTEAQRPTGATGLLRFNSDATSFEGYDGTQWSELGAGGSTQKVALTTHGFSVGDVLRYATSSESGTYKLAQAHKAGYAEVVGIVSKITDADNFTITTNGYVDLTDGSPSLIVGEIYYLATTTAGSLINEEPSDALQISKPLLTAITANTGYFTNYRGVENMSGNAVLSPGTTGSIAYYLTENSVGSSNNISLSGVNTGIGTSTPAYKLDVFGPARIDGNFVVQEGSTVTLPSGVISNTELENSSLTIGGVTLSLGDTDSTPAFDLTDATSLSITGGTTGTLGVTRGGTGLTTVSAGNLLYASGADTLAAAPNITVDGSGNIGLGSSTPSQKLVVAGNIVPDGDNRSLGTPANPWKDLYVSSSTIVVGSIKLSQSDDGSLSIEDKDDPNASIGITSGSQDIFDAESGGIATSSLPSSGYWTVGGVFDFVATSTLQNLLTIDSSGRVGIGTSSPQELFTVGNNFTVDQDGDITSNGNITASNLNTSNWNTSFGWGDHASVGYVTDGNTNWDNSYNLITLTNLSAPATGLNYNNTNGQFSLTSGYNIPLTASTTNWNTAYGWGDHSGLYLSPADYLSTTTHANLATLPSLLITESQISDLGTYLTGNQLITISGDATGSGATAITLSLSDDSVASSTLNITNSWSAGQFLSQDGFGALTWDNAAASLEDLTDTSITSTSTGQILRMDSDGKWKNTSDMSIAASGNIGIGTTSPLADLDVFGDIILSSSTSYISFGPTLGDSGYGLRNNAGTLEFKNNSDTSWSEVGSGGSTQKVALSTHGFSVGDILRYATSTESGTYKLAQANSIGYAEVVGIVSEVTDVNNFILTTNGYVDLSAGSLTLTEGEIYYLGTTTPGTLASLEPNGDSEISKPLLTAISTDEGYFTNYRGVENTPGTSPTFTQGGTGELAFYTGAASISSTDNITINGVNTGIGTSTPAYKLDVYGMARVDGTLITNTLDSQNVLMGAQQFTNDNGTLKWGNPGEEVAISDRSHVRVTQVSHGFSVQDAIRMSTTTPGTYVKSIATDSGKADVVGVVSEVDGNDFVVSTNGLVAGLSGLIAGET